jgi:DNA-binding winged helix-turn-helix (wHTH) protein/class 3 adenylate cyclase/tetratricopeptide (TPR) repeat protein
MWMRYLFGSYELNTETQELVQAGRLIQLAPKAYAVLVHLVVNRDRLVSKEELLEEIWPDTYVDDSAVKRNVMAVRRALSSGSGANAHIKTLRARGYRFMAPVEVRAPEPDSVADVMAVATDVPDPVGLPPVPEPVNPPHLSQPVIAEVPERKLITALYCRVSRQIGQDGIADLDTLHDLMQTVYAYAYEEAQGYGGTVQYLTGEGGLILFGIPLALEDHARRAVLTAWALHRRLQRHGDRLTLQVALHTGLVVFTPLHEQPQDMAAVVGDVTTLAAAMVQRAPQGAIVASDTTVDLIPDVVHALPLAPMHIAGTDSEMPMYRITDVLLEQPATRRFITPFVGRDVELAMLGARWQQAQKGQGQVVCIVGEPGIGKSRLLHEFRSTLTSSEKNLIYRRCDGRSYSRATPYLPILALLRRLWAISDADHDEHIAAKVNTGLREAALEADVLGPYFRSLLGGDATSEGLAGLSADVLRTRIFDALHQFFLRGSGTAPWVLEIENAHWIDATSEAYFTSLIDRLVGIPVLMLVTFRPGYRPAWLEKSYVTQLAIPALGPADSREMVAAILGQPGVDSATRQQLLAKAEGNPFFLEELARAMAEPNHVNAGRILPNTVHAVLAERIDRLAPAEKQLLQTAAVVGPEVPVRLLRAVANLPEDDLNHYLQRLQANEFLYETHLFPEPVYTFKHALTHEVAYANLLQSQRRQLHLRIVDALEDMDESERRVDMVEVLARHASGGERWEKACHYFTRAGVYATARSAYREAATSYQQALQSLAHLPEKKSQREQAVDLRLMLHAALFRSGDPARSMAVLGEAQQIAEVLDDPYRLGWTASYLSTHYFMAGDLEGALSYGLRARALADVCEDERLQVDVRLHLGQAYHARGDYAAAIGTLAPNLDFVHRVLRHHAPEDAPIPGSHALSWMVLCLAETGDFEQGERCIEDAFKILAMGESPYEQVVAYGSAGWLKLRRGDVATALPLLEQAMSYCQAAGIVQMLPVVASFLGAAYLQSGRRPEAIALLEEAVAQATAMRVMVYHALSMVCLGQAYRLDGRLADARAQAERAIVLAQTQKDRGHEAWAYHLLGETFAQDMASGTEMAAAAFRKALVRAETCGMRPLQAHCHLGLARLYRHSDGDHQTTRAEAERAAAVALYRSLDMPFWLSFAASV